MTGGMMFKGTPGEWFFAYDKFVRSYHDGDLHLVAEVISGDQSDQYLISAAPELLESLITLEKAMTAQLYRLNENAILEARAAIAKALGETK